MAPGMSKLATPWLETIGQLVAQRPLLTAKQRRNALYFMAGLTTMLALYKTYSSYKTKQRESQETTKIQMLPPPSAANQAALSRRRKVGVDRLFVKRMRAILKIIIPTWKSKEFFHLVLLVCTPPPLPPSDRQQT